MNETTNISTRIDNTWTLFLDRDGVINEENIGSYITTWDEFCFCEGSIEAIRQLSEVFGKIVVVTNQRGVGKGLMTLDTLKEIHVNMKNQLTEVGGRIDRIYVATALEDEDQNRKPNIGMAMQAREDFPEIDFKRSVMVGNSLTDMEFGKRAGMHTVFLTTKHSPVDLPHYLIDEQFPALLPWVQSIIGEPVG